MNTSRCRLEVYKTRSTLNAQVSEKEKELADCRTKLQQVESEVNQLLSEIQRTETKNSKSKVKFVFLSYWMIFDSKIFLL